MAATAAISLNSVCVQYVQIRPPDGSPKRHAYFASPKESEIEDGFPSDVQVKQESNMSSHLGQHSIWHPNKFSG